MSKNTLRLLTILLAVALILSGCGRQAVKTPEASTTPVASATPEVSATPDIVTEPANTPKPDEPIRDNDGPVFMWEVQGKDGQGKLYLLGSIHAGNNSLYPLDKTIIDAFEASDVLAVECDVTTQLQRPNLAEIMRMVMYTDGTTLKDHISPELYEKTAEILQKNGMPIDLVKIYKPSVVSSMILQFYMEDWGYDPNSGIDIHLIGKAKEKGMPVVEIESLEFQYSLLGGFNDTIQEMQLESCVNGELDASKEYLDQMFELWLKGDAEGLETLLEQEDDSLTPELMEAYKEYEKAMYDDRNDQMTLKAEEYLQTGDVYFFVVGSAHMVGESGIVEQLRSKGYTVTQQ